MDERVMSFSWANSPSMDLPFSDKAQGLRASPNGCPAIVIQRSVQMDARVMGVDAYNFKLTGDVACNINATSCDSPSHSGPSVIVRKEIQMDERLIVLNDQGGAVLDVSRGITATLRAQEHGHQPVVCFEPGIMSRDCSAGNNASIDICSTLRAQMGDNRPAVCYEISAGEARQSNNNVCQTLRSRMGTGGGNVQIVVMKGKQRRKYVLRRLTPTECARLQGFPDWWIDGAEGSDSAVYKMWGNGIALPCAADVIGRIVKELRCEDEQD